MFRKFLVSSVDPCVFYKDGIVVLIYADDCIFVSLKEVYLYRMVKKMKLTDEGDIKAYLGVDFVF